MTATLEDRVLNVLRHLAQGTHLCHFYQTPQDLLDVLVPYFAAGLSRGERCLWITDDALSIDEARQALAKAVPDFEKRLANGDIEFFKHTEWYLIDGKFDETRVLNQFAKKEAEAIAGGYSGLCVTGNTFWARNGHWSDLLNYEENVHRCFCNFRMSAVCTYPLERCAAADIVDVTKVHDIVLIRREGTWDVIENAELRSMRDELQANHERLRKLTHQLIIAERRERKRISRALHDGLQQTIVATQLNLSEARRKNGGIVHAEAIDRAELLLDEAMRECRTLTMELSPPILHDGCLVRSLQWLVQQFKDRYDLTSRLQIPAHALPLSERESVLLFEIVRELLFNVVKHAGVREAFLSLYKTEDELVLEVRDDGVGCDLQDIDSDDGSFGLLNIRERVGMLDGRFTLESSSGEGCTVTIALPREAAPESSNESDELDSSTDHPLPKREVTDENLRVLLVDDHAILRQGIARLLNDHDRIVVIGEAGDGVEAVEMTGHLQPDVIVMDISMPRMNGIEATRRIRAQHPNVRVIGVSMHDRPQMAESMLEAGAEAYFQKCGQVDELLDAIIQPSAHTPAHAGSEQLQTSIR